VILRCSEWQDRLAVDDGNEAGFLTGQEFLDNDAAAGFTERISLQHVAYGALGLGLGLRNDNALAGGKAVRLDDDRRALFGNISERGFDFGEGSIAGRWDLVPRHEFFRKGLGAFQLRGIFLRTETAQTCSCKAVDDTGNKRRLGADDCQINVFFGRKF